MPLYRCPGCSGPVSGGDFACPRCGQLLDSLEKLPTLDQASVPATGANPGMEPKKLDALRGWVAAEKGTPRFWPVAWSNVEVRFLVEEQGLGFRCDDKSVGRFRVSVVDGDLREVVFMEGANAEQVVPEVAINLLALPQELLRAMFHMARCKREHKRTAHLDHASGFAFFRARVVEGLNALAKR